MNFITIIKAQIIATLKSIKLLQFYLNDYTHFAIHSGCIKDIHTHKKLVAQISMSYHSIEKGITMPNRRLGFGMSAIIRLCCLCDLYIKKGYDKKDNQFMHAIAVIAEYLEIHQNTNFVLEQTLIERIERLLSQNTQIKASVQQVVTRKDYLRDRTASFDKFSASRYSIRNFEKGVDVNALRQALELAQNAPSSCNRQNSRVHIIQKEEKLTHLLNIQQGNRGFGNLCDKILIVTSEVGGYQTLRERNAGYVDGGMYGMNLLYALHFEGIGACTLNSFFTPQQDKAVKRLCSIPHSEIIVMIILIGNIPGTIHLAISKRQDINRIFTVNQGTF